MRIVLDLRIYGPKFGGLGRYNQKLLEHIINNDSQNHYIILLKEKASDFPELPNNFEVKICDCHWYSVKEQIVLPHLLKKLAPDLVHFPHFNVPIFYRGKFIVTVHDLIMTKFPSIRTSSLNRVFFLCKRLAYQITIRRAIKKARIVIAVSEFTAGDIKKYFKLNYFDAEKIKVIYEGLSLPNTENTDTLSLPAKFLLYVGNAYPHKNLEFLIQGFAEFNKKHPEFNLILIGNKNYFYQRLEKYTETNFANLKNKIIFTGFVHDKKLADYYRQATLYIFPSLYEGFGLPPLEAMTFNLPVLSSNTSCLPEILGDAALYFDPKNLDYFLTQLEKMMSSHDLRQSLRHKGNLQIQKYSWDKMAKQILEIYQK